MQTPSTRAVPHALRHRAWHCRAMLALPSSTPLASAFSPSLPHLTPAQPYHHDWLLSLLSTPESPVFGYQGTLGLLSCLLRHPQGRQLHLMLRFILSRDSSVERGVGGKCHFDLHYSGEAAAKLTYRFTRLGVYIDSGSPRAWAQGWRALLSHSHCYKAWIDCAETKRGLTSLQPRPKSGPDSTKITLRITVLLITDCPLQQPNRNHRITNLPHGQCIPRCLLSPQPHGPIPPEGSARYGCVDAH